MSIYNWGFNNFYINSFMPTPYWGSCGCNAFNSGFRFGIFNSLLNYTVPQMNIFSFTPQLSMPLFNPFNNVYTMANNYVIPSFMANPFDYSIQAAFSQLNTFNNYTKQLSDINTNFNLLTKNKKENSTNTEIKTNTNNNENSNNVKKETSEDSKENIKPRKIKTLISKIKGKINKRLKHKNKLDSNFLNKVKEVANNLNCDYKDLLAVLNSESGLDPKAWNGKTAVGLIQFTDQSIAELNRIHGLNLTKEKIAQMSAIEQLDLAEKYLKIAKSYNFAPNARLSAGDLYAITFLPGRANQNVLCRKGEKYYSQNKGLDINNDGVISKEDLENRLAKKQINESIFA